MANIKIFKHPKDKDEKAFSKFKYCKKCEHVVIAMERPQVLRVKDKNGDIDDVVCVVWCCPNCMVFDCPICKVALNCKKCLTVLGARHVLPGDEWMFQAWM